MSLPDRRETCHNSLARDPTPTLRTWFVAQVLINATPRRDENGEVIGVLAVGQDITKIAKAQNELRQV